jgi:hypothetical protein
MKKLFSILFLAFILILSACGKDESATESNTTDAASAEFTSDEAAGVEEAPPQVLELQEKIDRVGDKVLTDGKEFYIVKKDEYTYLIQEGQRGELVVSVEKDNEWVAFEVTSSIFEKDKTMAQRGIPYFPRFMSSSDSLLMSMETSEGLTHYNSVYNVTFSPDGSADFKLVKDTKLTEGTDADHHIALLHGTSGKAFISQGLSDTTSELYDDNGERLYSLSNVGVTHTLTMGEQPPLLFDEDRKILHVDNSMYDLEEDNWVWDDMGAEKEYDSILTKNAYKPNENGIYLFGTNEGGYDYTLSYSLLGEDTLIESSSYEIPWDLYPKDAAMIVNKDTIDIYEIAEFQGENSLQKYTFNRID